MSYSRIRVQSDATTGQPTGYGPASTLVPARGVVVQAFQLYLEVNQSGQTIPTWRLAGSTVTDLNGTYGFSNTILSGYSTFIEVDGAFQMQTGNLSSVRIVSDPNGITSSKTEPNRPIWAYREDMNGNPLPNQDPTASPSRHHHSLRRHHRELQSGRQQRREPLGVHPAQLVPPRLDLGRGAAIPPGGNRDHGRPGAGHRGLHLPIRLLVWGSYPVPGEERGAPDLHYHPGTSRLPGRHSWSMTPPPDLAGQPAGQPRLRRHQTTLVRHLVRQPGRR